MNQEDNSVFNVERIKAKLLGLKEMEERGDLPGKKGSVSIMAHCIGGMQMKSYSMAIPIDDLCDDPDCEWCCVLRDLIQVSRVDCPFPGKETE